MNKTYMIIMGAALLALAACSRDEVKETAKEQAIDFRIAVDTRAEATTTDNIGSFYVTAIDGTGNLYFKDVMYSDTDKYMIVCIINKRQVGEMMTIIKSHPDTFASFEKVNEVFGNFKRKV